MAALTRSEIRGLLSDLVDAAGRTADDDAEALIGLYATAISNADTSYLCAVNKAAHQSTDGSCDQCGMKNLN